MFTTFYEVLIFRSKQSYRSSRLVFYYQHISAVQISNHQVGGGYTKGM